MKKIKWTDEVIQFMINNYKGKDNIELANLLNKRFNLNTNGDRVSNEKAKLKIRKGIDLRTGINRGCIKKGNIPPNKDKKWDEYLTKEQQEKCRTTCYKKGNIPFNHREIGEERTTDDGYIMIKIKDGCLNKNWQLKHRYIYEKEYGKIPEGYNLIFLDGNRKNFDLSNLKLVSKYEDLIMNNNKLFSQDKDITETGTIIANVINETYKKEKDNERNNKRIHKKTKDRF